MTDQLTPAAVARLVGLRDWYVSVDPHAKVFFEAFYQKDRALTVEVLTYGEVPASAIAGDSLEAALEWAAGTATVPAPHVTSHQQEVRVADGERGTLRWTVHLGDGALDSWEDQIVVYGAAGDVIHDEKVARAGLEAGGEREDSFELPAMPPGVYAANVWVNVGGAQRGEPAGPQGYRDVAQVTVIVGSNAATQTFDEMPVMQEMVSAMMAAGSTPWEDDGGRTLRQAVEAAARLERLGPGFTSELDRARAILDTAPTSAPENWPELQERLRAAATGDLEQVGNIVLSLVAVIDEIT